MIIICIGSLYKATFKYIQFERKVSSVADNSDRMKLLVLGTTRFFPACSHKSRVRCILSDILCFL